MVSQMRVKHLQCLCKDYILKNVDLPNVRWTQRFTSGLAKNMKVKDFVIVITWVDDVRYFGTNKFVKEL